MDLDKAVDEIFTLLNRVRSDPRNAAQQMLSLKERYSDKMYNQNIKTREGVAALYDLLTDLKSRPKNNNNLKWSFALHMVADEQAKLLGENGLLTTEGSNMHKSLPLRCEPYAVIDGRLSEVYEFGGESGQQVIDWLLIDDGLASRKRRKTLLDPIYRYIGVGASLHSVHGFVTVIVLAQKVHSIVAPGTQGTYLVREPIAQGKQFFYVQKSQQKNPPKQVVEVTNEILNMFLPSKS